MVSLWERGRDKGVVRPPLIKAKTTLHPRLMGNLTLVEGEKIDERERTQPGRELVSGSVVHVACIVNEMTAMTAMNSKMQLKVQRKTDTR